MEGYHYAPPREHVMYGWAVGLGPEEQSWKFIYDPIPAKLNQVIIKHRATKIILFRFYSSTDACFSSFVSAETVGSPL